MGDGVVYAFMVVNLVAAVAVMVLWARFLGYRPERNPRRARLVAEARGYVPVGSATRGEGR
jgi:hypothetical protein